jgi:hypothetical protein
MAKDEALKMAIEMLEKLSYEYGQLLDGDQDYGLLPSEINADIIKTYHIKRICQEALEQPAQEPVVWEDKEDEWSKDIDAYHPVNTKAYADWDVAQRMVSNRRSKHDLTALVCWLLQTNKNDTQFWDFSDIDSKAFIEKIKRKLKEKNHD